MTNKFATNNEHIYFDWLVNTVTCGVYAPYPVTYNSLLYFLYNTEFIALLDNDVNRIEDGIYLRYDFSIQDDSFDDIPELDKPCSILEMMIALANRMENQVADELIFGDRVPLWFWSMIKTLGLTTYSDGNFDELEVRPIINKFLHRRYKKNGEGGLFIVADAPEDLRHVEIWNQAMWYLTENY